MEEGKKKKEPVLFFPYKQGRDLADVLIGRGETNPIVLVQPSFNITDGK